MTNTIPLTYPVNNQFDYGAGRLTQWLEGHRKDNMVCTHRQCIINREQWREIAKANGAVTLELGQTLYMFGDAFAANASEENEGGNFIIFHTADTQPPVGFDVFPSLENEGRVLWFYQSQQHGIQSSVMRVTGNDPLPCFYPWIDNLQSIYQEFYDSPANVLLLMGPPGTGKTTFLRGFVRALKMEAWVTYDEKVQTDEGFYTRFGKPESNDDEPRVIDASLIKGKAGRVLILEDADTMLEKRRDGNKLMSRILNLSDGLVTLPKRKIIFTTNIVSMTGVDEALLRPGRCFGVIKFQELTAMEARHVCRVLDRPLPISPTNVTLADLLNEGRHNNNSIRKIGFV